MDQLQLIRERLNLVDYINQTMPLKKLGRNFKAKCPFHNEKTPSFVVSPERQIWHCFGCGKGGDIFSYLMEMEHLEFPEALKILATQAGVKLDYHRPDDVKTRRRERLLSLHHLAQEYYHYLLTLHQVGERCRQYLKERGMTDKLIQTFGLGFAPNAWNNLANFLHKKGYSDDELEISGLVLKGQRGLYDRFRGRVMFPLKNHRGEILAFSGRLLDKDAPEAKYINSPETQLYIKGQLLYGLDVTKDHIRRENTAVVVEGEFDLISSFQAGVANVVAIKGSAVTEHQVNLIKRFTEKIILALDQDQAGDAAARRGIEIADQAGLEIRVAPIPQGKDPDEAARENPKLWQQAVKTAASYYDFIISSALKRFGVGDAYAKKKVSDAVLPTLVKITNPIIQAHYIKDIATKLDIPEERFTEALKKITLPKTYDGPQKNPSIAKTQTELLEEQLLSLLLQSNEVKPIFNKITRELDPSDFVNPAVRKIFLKLIDYAAQQEQIDLPIFLKTLPAEVLPQVDLSYLQDFNWTADPDSTAKELQQTLVALKRLNLRRKIKTLTTQLKQAETDEQSETLIQLNEQLRELTTSLKQLS